MIVFTLRTTNTPQAYDNSLAALRLIYPEILVIDAGDNPDGRHAGWITDKMRIDLLANGWPGEAVLYLDMDAVAHERINPDDYKKPAFPNLIGGVLDYWAILRPAGCEPFFQNMLKIGKWDKWAWIQKVINEELRGQVELIYGYPSFKYLGHLELSKKTEGD